MVSPTRSHYLETSEICLLVACETYKSTYSSGLRDDLLLGLRLRLLRPDQPRHLLRLLRL